LPFILRNSASLVVKVLKLIGLPATQVERRQSWVSSGVVSETTTGNVYGSPIRRLKEDLITGSLA